MSDWRTDFDSMLAEELASHERWCRALIEQGLENDCESEIERLLLVHLIDWLGGINTDEHMNFHLNGPGLTPEEVKVDAGMRIMGRSRYADLYYALAPQCKIGPYRADAMLLASFVCDVASLPYRSSELHLVIECDGHDFHERTKEQAARDRMRDRWFTARGYKVLRFTGSEIFRNPRKCASEVSAFVQSWANEQRRAAGYPEEALA
jgi:very-short-patch-repair endonuclease